MFAQLVENEQSGAQLSVNYKHPDGCTIRVDSGSASGFTLLENDKYLRSLGIILDFGRIKNKNQNA